MIERGSLRRLPLFLGLLAGVAIVAGSLLSWWDAPGPLTTAAGDVDIPVAGYETTLGLVTLGAGVVVVVASVLARLANSRWPLIVMLLGSLAAISAGAVAYTDQDEEFMRAAIQPLVDSEAEFQQARAEILGIVAGVQGYPAVEVGLYVVLAGGAIGVLSVIWGAFPRRRTTGRSLAAPTDDTFPVTPPRNDEEPASAGLEGAVTPAHLEPPDAEFEDHPGSREEELPGEPTPPPGRPLGDTWSG